MEIHPDKIPVSKTFHVENHNGAVSAINEMLLLDFNDKGVKILLPKDRSIAKRLGYMIVNELNNGLRARHYKGAIRYFVYHYNQYYALVIVSQEVMARLQSERE